jgi:hypothetical protein
LADKETAVAYHEKTGILEFCMRTTRVMAPLALACLLPACTGTTDAVDELSEAAENVVIDPNAPAPTVSLSANPTEVDAGGVTTLTWSATNAESCQASGGGWSGSLPGSGSEVVGPLDQGTTFSVNCVGPGGNSLQMIRVGVIGPVELSWVAPTENVDGSELTDLAGYRIYYGDESRNYSGMVDLTNASATSHTLTLASGDYFVAMTAYDAEGNESAYSNEVLKTRL